ncbi:uncharacterized protein VTP21DRAFT_399 [Calcarisporiella thermophila]|uniref:uncharacterized protein n=1 Tax=Calcarisporiella thermophila TaxID=911321 RepID=UPI00374454F2
MGIRSFIRSRWHRVSGRSPKHSTTKAFFASWPNLLPLSNSLVSLHEGSEAYHLRMRSPSVGCPRLENEDSWDSYLELLASRNPPTFSINSPQAIPPLRKVHTEAIDAPSPFNSQASESTALDETAPPTPLESSSESRHVTFVCGSPLEPADSRASKYIRQNCSCCGDVFNDLDSGIASIYYAPASSSPSSAPLLPL